jgi:hypothetical protein
MTADAQGDGKKTQHMQWKGRMTLIQSQSEVEKHELLLEIQAEN